LNIQTGIQAGKYQEVYHESFQRRQFVFGLPQTELPKKNTIRAYKLFLAKFLEYFPQRDLASITSEEILSFLTKINDGCRQLTKHTRYAILKALFNFIRNNLEAQFHNPCDMFRLKKLFRPEKLAQWTFIDKEAIDEIIFRTTQVRNRLILELMARGGMRPPMLTDQGSRWKSSARSF
jgi:site-specific recombinase XerD